MANFRLRFQSSMGSTMGWRVFGRVSMLSAWARPIRSVHCQSQLDSVGNPASAGCFVSFHRPSIQVREEFIRRFQKMGTLESANSRLSFDVSGRKRTLPPPARLACASGHALAIRTPEGTEASTWAGLSQKSHELWNGVPCSSMMSLYSAGAWNLERSAVILPRAIFFPRGISRAGSEPEAMDFPAVSTMRHAAVVEVRGLGPKCATSTSLAKVWSLVNTRPLNRVSGTVVLLYWRNSAGPT